MQKIRAAEQFKILNAMKKLLIALPFVFAAVLLCAPVKAQQNQPAKEDVAFKLPAMVSEKTVPLFDQTFEGMPGVKIVAYCYNMDLIVFEVDRSIQPNDDAIHQKIHSIFKTDDNSLKLESIKSFNRGGFLVMCNATDLVTR
jgi:hypothetical protein